MFCQFKNKKKLNLSKIKCNWSKNNTFSKNAEKYTQSKKENRELFDYLMVDYLIMFSMLLFNVFYALHVTMFVIMAYCVVVDQSMHLADASLDPSSYKIKIHCDGIKGDGIDWNKSALYSHQCRACREILLTVKSFRYLVLVS